MSLASVLAFQCIHYDTTSQDWLVWKKNLTLERLFWVLITLLTEQTAKHVEARLSCPPL